MEIVAVHIVSLKTTSKVEARERLSQIERLEKDIKSGMTFSFPWMNDDGLMQVVHYSLEIAIHDYLKVRQSEGLRIGTVEIYKNALFNLMSIAGKNIPVDQVTIQIIEQMKTKIGSNISNATLNMKLRAIKTFFNWLSENDYIEQKPNIKLVKIKKSLPSYFTDKEWGKINDLDLSTLTNGIGLLKYPEWNHYKRAWEFYYQTGCRLSEPFIGTLEGNWLVINADISKTNIDREVYIPDKLIEIVKEMQYRLALFTSKNKRDFIKRYSRLLKDACRNVGIENRHFHNLRHTYAVRRYLQTQDIYLVAKELGHSSVTTTEIYAKFNLRHLKQDFPLLTFAYKDEGKPSVFGFRDTDSRDTLIISDSNA